MAVTACAGCVGRVGHVGRVSRVGRVGCVGPSLASAETLTRFGGVTSMEVLYSANKIQKA
eukprot:1286808-Prymnesium_polylepis.1